LGDRFFSHPSSFTFIFYTSLILTLIFTLAIFSAIAAYLDQY
jgi:hypothetical protein